MTDASTLKSVLSDAELILSTRAGDSDAYSELYVRHIDSARAAAGALTRSKADIDDIVAEAFSRVLSVLQRGGGPDVSFRPYLLTAVRNAFYDRTRRARREEVTDDMEDSINVSLLDAANSDDDRAMVAAAFASLPERWQLVLWHTEVEGRSPAEVAPLLGLAPNAVAALAYRAREGLRTAYLQSHLQKPLDAECKECAANLAAYVRDGLSARERRKVDEHLQTCDTCKALLAELEDANTHLKAVLIPLLIGVPAAKYLSGIGIISGLRHGFRAVRTAALGSPAAAGAVAAAVISAIVVTGVAIGGGFGSSPKLAGAPPAATSNAPGNSSGGTGAGGIAPVTGDTATVDTATPDTGAEDTQTTDATETTESQVVPSSIVTVTVPRQGNTSQSSSPAGGNSSQGSTGTTTPSQTSTPTTAATTTQTTTATTTAPTTGTTTASTTPSTQPANTTATTAATTPTTEPATTTSAEPATTTTAPTTTTPPVEPPLLAIGAELVAPAFSPGQAVIGVNVTNGTPGGVGAARRPEVGPANNMQVSVSLPPGVTLARIDTPSWLCSTGGGVLTCSAPTLADASRDSARITLNIPPAAESFSLTFTLTADGIAPVSSQNPLLVQVTPLPAGGISSTYDHGSVVAIGNTSMTCNEEQDILKTCAAAQQGDLPNALANRQQYLMRHVQAQTTPDPDEVMPFNSSISKLDLGTSTATSAYLMWGADTEGPLGNTSPDRDARDHVRFKTPDGAIHDLVATEVSDYGDDSRYTAMVDVTDLVQKSGSGNYQVSNIQASEDFGTFAGWSLVVVTHNDADPLRLLTVVAPNGSFNQQADFRLAMPVSAGADDRAATLAVTAFEGELGLFPEFFRVNDTNVKNETNPVNNPFNGSVLGAVDNVFVNNFGLDVDQFGVTVPGEELTIEARSQADFVHIGLIAIAVDL